LGILKEAEVVDSVRERQEIYYWANNHLVADVLRELANEVDSKCSKVNV
jgi:hypothetical protein